MSWRSEPLKIWPRNYWNWSSTDIPPVSGIRLIPHVGAALRRGPAPVNRDPESEANDVLKRNGHSFCLKTGRLPVL